MDHVPFFAWDRLEYGRKLVYNKCVTDKYFISAYKINLYKKHKNRKGETKRWQLRLILSPASLEPVKLH